jgi:pyruvate formate lyase activating enzyme
VKKGVVFDIQRFTIHDGPGIRTEVFLKGCPLKCLWCSNPESINPRPELGVFKNRCIGLDKCGKCVKACPFSALIVSENKVVGKDKGYCTECLKCVEVCPSNALVAFGRVMTVKDVVDELERDKPFYEKSGGGVTLSGGDPLVQEEFVLEILKECKKRGLHTCLETEGYASWGKIEKLLPYVDMMLYDIKCINSNKHREYTGVGNELILENVKKIASRNIPLIIRIPVVPGYTDSIENIDETSKFISNHLGHTVKQVQLLPYHAFARPKYEALGLEYGLMSVEYPTKEHVMELVERMRSFGLPAVMGAYSEIEGKKM